MEKAKRKLVLKTSTVVVIFISLWLCMSVSFASENVEIVKQKEDEGVLVKIGGYTQLMYVVDPTLDGKEPFIIKRARVSFSKVLNNWASFKLQPDFAGIAKEPDGGKVAFREAWIELTLHKDFFRFRLGQYHQPFGFENNYSTAKKKLSDFPFYMGKILTTEYDYGVQWWGNLSFLNWRIGVINGSGSITENNKSKDVAGRILISPLRELEIGFSLYLRNLEILHYGSHLKVETNIPCPVFFTGEYAGGEDSTGSAKVLDAIGTLELKPFVGIRILNELAPTIRFEYWDPNLDKKDDEIKHFTFGLNFYPHKAIRLLVDYTIKSETPGKNNNRLNIMLQVNY